MRFFAAALVFTAPLAAQCTFVITPTSPTVPLTASTGNTITVTAPTDPLCNPRWAPSPNPQQAPWLTIPAADQAIHTGSGTFTFAVEANPYGFTRSTDITVSTGAGAIFVRVTQNAPPCKFGLTPDSQKFAVAGGPGSVTVQANCPWAATTATQFVSLPPAGGFSDATVKFTVAANGCVAGRSGSISVSTSLGTTLVSSITQDGSPANFTLSATSATANSAAGDNRFTVTTGQGCNWSAASDVSWMTIISGASGSGSGGIAYHLAANTSATRSGNIRVNTSPTTQLLFTVTQQGATAPPPVIANVKNAANYATDAVSPGAIVTVIGQNLGPVEPALLQVVGGSLTTNLGGTQVLFDGVAAPLTYSSQGQVNAVAPYGLAGKASTQVQVNYNGAVSDAMTMPVQPSTPAIFTLDASGLGPGAILNQDLSINSAALPADRGSVVAIYCTGGGTTNPATADGAIVSGGLPRLTLPVSVTIGGLDAKVPYAGGVPGSIAGLTQINAEVPAGVATGTKVPIVVKVGDASSTSGVTISVK